MATLAERVQERIDETGVTVQDIATAADVSVQAVYAVLSGETKTLKGGSLVGYAAALKTHEKWLESGTGPKVRIDPPGYAHLARETPLPFAPRPDVISVPVFDVAASMGLGAAMPDHDTIVGSMQLSRDWVSRSLPSGATAKALAVITAYGDSMEPTFRDGDILLVDRGVTDLRVDTVYVLEFNGELYIKRIQRRRDGSIEIISDNKNYTPEVVPPSEKESVRVLGRVLYAWNGKKI